jgi:predicted DNA-binding transcriptional regulator AlpA
MAEKPTDDKILLPDEVSQILRVEVDTLYRWRLRGGGPPFIRKGRGRGRIGYRKSDIDQYILDSLRTSTSQEAAA